MRWSRTVVALTATTTLALSATGCGSTDAGQTAPDADGPPAGGPAIVASTTWVGALARAAGVADITVIAPANVQHPPDYDPKPSDLAAVADADYVLYAEFDGFADRLTEAAGGDAELIAVQLENTPAAITAEVNRLGALFGTADAATAWLAEFDSTYAELSEQVKTAAPEPGTAVAQLFIAYWAEFAGLQVAGTYGPQPVTASQLAELTAAEPTVVLANAHLPGANPDVEGAARVDIINYPGDDLDLLTVFRTNAENISAALA
ncbi:MULTISPECIES: zinc ABC transporter substrate-binding protein [unclassified Solwaraspora]|uniref:metal ABC transporter solute-binding protein, Zn/Mn family n=1 Tax=unclassified Solwaraspora TaxID=2627926 RepID=UPI00248BBB44|nr:MULTISPECIES: zinc ABC transporter substrate-binding protein [unclassified Solwaraspora]WBB98902.1 zinc ABC transporter substrate-binding protein [Solwaraspora sp. WMMA2059]WBC22545.1 zinc ABC transporter substrate-binding protein [Solwaraspora sp. WMMA2080]WJK35401.1 zinc ABC transporter substrate-binding protein [Solwaraspora sp. WMMA2065]